MPTIRLIHWNAAEAEACGQRIAAAGYTVACDLPAGPDFLRQLRQAPPLAVVIDLSRLPSQGRDFGVAIRVAAATRRVPLVFVGGSPEKVAPVRAVLPDATFTTWEQIEVALAEAIHNPPAQPIVPESTMAGYSGQPLIKKLGIKPAMTIGLAHPPEPFDETLGALPPDTLLCELGARPCGLAIWFVRSRGELADDLSHIVALAGDAPLWIAWPKKASGLASDVSEKAVRAAGLAAGWVDYKICAIDETWSGLLFRRRK